MNPDWFLIEADTIHSAASRKFKVGSPQSGMAAPEAGERFVHI